MERSYKVMVPVIGAIQLLRTQRDFQFSVLFAFVFSPVQHITVYQFILCLNCSFVFN